MSKASVWQLFLHPYAENAPYGVHLKVNEPELWGNTILKN